MIQTPEERIADYLAMGLTEAEVSYLTTPVSKMNADQKMTALAIYDRKTKLVREANEIYADAQAREAALKRAEAEGEEAEIDGDDELSIHA